MEHVRSQIRLSPTRSSSLHGKRAHSDRAKAIYRLVSPLAPLLPADIDITISDHDMGGSILGDDQRRAAMKAITEGNYLSPKELKAFQKKNGRREVEGLVSACPEGSLAWNRSLALQAGEEVPDLPKEGENSHFASFPSPRRRMLILFGGRDNIHP